MDIESKKMYHQRAEENRRMYAMEVSKYQSEKNVYGKCPTISSSSLEEGSTNVLSCSAGGDCVPQIGNSQVELIDLGFAKQKKFPWHPAMKTGELARGTRVEVTYFGTGQSGIVDSSNWVVYTQQTEERIKNQSLMKNIAFKNGLEQLKSLREKLLNADGSPVTAPAIEISATCESRRLRALDKDRLQKEDEENVQLLRKKMRQLSDMSWLCVDCGQKEKYTHKAKAHARLCGQRKKLSKKRPAADGYECSKAGCNFTSSTRSMLHSHYRYTI